MFKDISSYRVGNYTSPKDRADLFICIEHIDGTTIGGRQSGFVQLDFNRRAEYDIYQRNLKDEISNTVPIPLSIQMIRRFPSITVGNIPDGATSASVLLRAGNKSFQLSFNGDNWTSSDFYHMPARFVHEFQNILADITGEMIQFQNS